MSGYFHADADEWEAEHYAGRWSATNRAPRWWASLDLAWMIDRRRLPSVRELAEAWGWTRSTVHDFLVANAEKHRAWDKRPEAQAWMADALPVRTVGGRLPPKSRGQKVDTRGTSNASNPEPGRTNDGQSPDTFRTVGGRLAGARSDPSPSDSTQHPAPTVKGEREGANLTTPPASDPDGSVPPADLTSAMEGSYVPTTDPTPEHVNETSDGDRAEGGDVPRVVSGEVLGERGIYTPSPEAGLFGAKWVAALAPEVVPEPKPVPVVVAPTPPPPVEPAPEKPKRVRKERPPVDESDTLAPLWSALVAFTPAPGAWRLNAERRAMLAERVAEHGPEVVARVAEWVRTSTHDRARFLRERGDPMTLLRKSKFDAYAAMSAGPVPKANGANGKPPARRGMLAIEAFMDDDDPGPVQPRIILDAETWQ